MRHADVRLLASMGSMARWVGVRLLGRGYGGKGGFVQHTACLGNSPPPWHPSLMRLMQSKLIMPLNDVS